MLPIIPEPWAGKDVLTGFTAAELAHYVNESDALLFAKAAAIRICRSYAIRGICDPAYIANVIQAELDRFTEGEATP